MGRIGKYASFLLLKAWVSNLNRDSRHGLRAGYGSIQKEDVGLGSGKRRRFHSPLWRLYVNISAQCAEIITKILGHVHILANR